jgi:translation initiation factor IF-3
MWFAPMIGPGDLDHKIKRVIEFLEERHMVKLTIKIPGRIDHQLAINLMKTIIERLSEKGTPEGYSKHEGRSIIQLIKPK